MEIWTALAIGFLGSFHCIGMCGPIALALPGQRDSGFSFIAGRSLYNAGRIISYTIMGAVLGLIGYSAVVTGLQQMLSILLGILIILAVLIKNSNLSSIRKKLKVESLYQYLKKAISEQFKKSGMGSLLTIGLLNGFLPCGFVYVGLAGSATTGSALNGALYMTLFGIGTFPAMFLMSIAPGFITLSMRRKIQKVIPVLAILFGCYLIYRGIFSVQSVY
ncbi:MAG: sulfite exporter TauE/SafE family protein [Balneolaceae bacterium]|nr:sulfite exporter TauE/SafE family protein [Balneolaceae bacterium]